MDCMLENIAYVGLGFASVLLGLEGSMAFYSLQIKRQVNKALFIQANRHIKIERQMNESGR